MLGYISIAFLKEWAGMILPRLGRPLFSGVEYSKPSLGGSFRLGLGIKRLSKLIKKKKLNIGYIVGSIVTEF